MLQTLEGDTATHDEIVRVLRLLADPTRLRLLRLLQHSELNVSAICRRLELAQPTVSHHLGLLRSVGLVCNRRQGKQVFYCLNTDSVDQYEAPGGLAISTGPVTLQLRVNGSASAAEPQCA